PGHTLQPTALVHEAYLRLLDQTRIEVKNRAHFYTLASRLMRRILVDHARARGRDKRGGDRQRISLDSDVAPTADSAIDLLAIDEALERLAALSPRKARLVEMRFFAGLSEQEAADALGVSRTIAARDWSFARTWLSRELRGASPR